MIAHLPSEVHTQTPHDALREPPALEGFSCADYVDVTSTASLNDVRTVSAPAVAEAP